LEKPGNIFFKINGSPDAVMFWRL